MESAAPAGSLHPARLGPARVKGKIMSRTETRTAPCGLCRQPVDIESRYTAYSRLSGKPLCGRCYGGDGNGLEDLAREQRYRAIVGPSTRTAAPSLRRFEPADNYAAIDAAKARAQAYREQMTHGEWREAFDAGQVSAE